MSYKLLKHFASVDDILQCQQLERILTNNFEPGRQGTGYEKTNLKPMSLQAPWQEWLPTFVSTCLNALDKPLDNEFWDCFLLRYPNGSHIPPHKDEASVFGKRHKRLNVLVRAPSAGGDLLMSNEKVVLEEGDAVLFFPDEVEHSVTTVSGHRLVFTVGMWL